jgi:hypothetical protein
MKSSINDMAFEKSNMIYEGQMAFERTYYLPHKEPPRKK